MLPGSLVQGGCSCLQVLGDRPGHLVKNKHFNKDEPLLQVVSHSRYRSSPSLVSPVVPQNMQCIILMVSLQAFLDSCLCSFFGAFYHPNFHFRLLGSSSKK